MAIYTVHAGHAAPGNKFVGAVGYCSESYVDRQIKNELVRILKKAGHTVYDCTVDTGISQGNIITQIKRNINSVKSADSNISIHLNASKKRAKDGKTTGVECCIYSLNNKSTYNKAFAIANNIKDLGFTYRGVKERTNLGVLKGIKNGGDNILVECFFCDDEDDFLLYSKLGAKKIAQAIADGLMGQINDSNPQTDKPAPKSNYIYKNVDYSRVFNANYYALKNPDIKKAYGDDTQKLFEHFLIFGMREGRIASADFNVKVYKERYLDLTSAFGHDLPKYYEHYCTHGFLEGRKAI